jgi:hypothetical protein
MYLRAIAPLIRQAPRLLSVRGAAAAAHDSAHTSEDLRLTLSSPTKV